VRLMMVTSDLRIGGAEVLAARLARALVARGAEIVVAPVRRGGVLAEQFAAGGACVAPPLSRWRFDPLAPRRAAGLIRDRRIEAVLVVNTLRNGLPFALGGAAWSGLDPATLCWCHSHYRSDTRVARRLERYRRWGWLDAVVCISRNQRRELTDAGLRRRGVALIRNGVELARFSTAMPAALDVPPGRKLVVQVANVAPPKDHATLLAAAGALAARRDDFHLALVGRGTDSPALARAADRAGLAGRVSLLGERDNVLGILAAADVFALASRAEAFPLSVLEAMAARRAVVVTDLPAYDEFFEHGREGLKTPPGDPQALAGAIERLLDDESLRAALGQAAQRRAARYAESRMTDGFERLLAAALRRKRRR